MIDLPDSCRADLFVFGRQKKTVLSPLAEQLPRYQQSRFFNQSLILSFRRFRSCQPGPHPGLPTLRGPPNVRTQFGGGGASRLQCRYASGRGAAVLPVAAGEALPQRGCDARTFKGAYHCVAHVTGVGGDRVGVPGGGAARYAAARRLCQGRNSCSCQEKIRQGRTNSYIPYLR